MGYGPAFSGAAEGAAAGASVGGVYGAVIGGVIGALGGMGADKEARKARKAVRAGIRTQYGEQRRQLYKDRSTSIGQQRTMYAAANVVTQVGTPQVIQDEVQFEFARAMKASQLAEQAAIKSGSPGTGANFWTNAVSSLNVAGSIKGALPANKAAGAEVKRVR